MKERTCQQTNSIRHYLYKASHEYEFQCLLTILILYYVLYKRNVRRSSNKKENGNCLTFHFQSIKSSKNFVLSLIVKAMSPLTFLFWVSCSCWLASSSPSSPDLRLCFRRYDVAEDDADCAFDRLSAAFHFDVASGFCVPYEKAICAPKHLIHRDKQECERHCYKLNMLPLFNF